MESSPDQGSTSDGSRLVVEPLDPGKARRFIWVVLLILAGLQAWTARFTATPDGISYVDLSDAVVSGHIGQIVNAYWSPLYPALVGVLRLIFGPGAYWEFAILHALNWLLFAASLAAYEYFLNGLTVVAVRWGRLELTTAGGRLVAYAVFGGLSLMMMPLSLPTPDLLLSTSAFLVFGALLRLGEMSSPRRDAVVLGLALAMGSLAKSFFIPWSVVVLLVLWMATRRSGRRPTVTAVAVWLVFVGPWCAVLSNHEGHFSVGDTGRLTYVWFVNEVESPSAKVMPHGAATVASNSVLVGAAVTPDARGTNPVWFDPARWYTGLAPRWSASQEVATFSKLVGLFFSTLSPVFLVLWFAYAAATRSARHFWWQRVWIVVVPALVAMGAYSLVLVTTRYIAPFLVTLIVAAWFMLRWPSRVTPARMLVGIGVPLMIIMTAANIGSVLSYVDGALGGVIIAWSARRWGPKVMPVAGVLGAIATYVLLPPDLRSFTMIGSVLILASFWIASRHAIRNHEGRRFSLALRRGLLISNGLIVVVVAVLKYRTSVAPLQVLRGEPNINWLQAEAMRTAGIGPGMRVAVVGSPFEAYWARTGRLQIVGVVPPWRVRAFQEMSAAKRAILFAEFARVGASAVVSQTPLPPIVGDTTWKPHEYVGWIKRLQAR